MQFKDVKQNYPVYILDKQNVTYQQGKVTSVSFPHIDNTNPMAMGKTVVDVAIEADGKTATYAIPDSMSIAYAGDLVLSTDKDGIIRELEAKKGSLEQYLSGVDKAKEDLDKTTNMLADLNPEIRAKQENEQRLIGLEESVKEMKDIITKLYKEIKS